ncbi:hypothetical protein MMC11_003497, partial [Xylographa trunciseda]|nr:hypothetical protein [Xylographa trunciseda]
VGADYEPSTWEASEAAADPMTMSITLRQTGPGPFTVTRTYVSPTHCSTLKIEGDFSFSCQI